MQFRLSTLVGITTGTAIACAVFFAVPLLIEVPLLFLIALVAPSVWICGACFARQPWRAFFLGGLCAGIIPQMVLMFDGGNMGFALLSIGQLPNFESAGDDYQILVRISIAAAFLFPGFVSLLGGVSGALVYRWFGPAAVRPAPESRLNETYAVIESRLTPLVRESERAAT